MSGGLDSPLGSVRKYCFRFTHNSKCARQLEVVLNVKSGTSRQEWGAPRTSKKMQHKLCSQVLPVLLYLFLFCLTLLYYFNYVIFLWFAQCRSIYIFLSVHLSYFFVVVLIFGDFFLSYSKLFYFFFSVNLLHEPFWGTPDTDNDTVPGGGKMPSP